MSADKQIVILGASGLIGHKLLERFGQQFSSVTAILHRDRSTFAECGLFDAENTVERVDVRNFEHLSGILHSLRPDVVLNCAGLTKRRPEIEDKQLSIGVNALFPHKLAQWAGENNARMIHFSTDCVFDGADGPYTEESPTTGKDTYGQTKALGEVKEYEQALTIRSSFIGRELAVHSELLAWFLQQEGQTIRGFTQAWYSGVSTSTMCDVVARIITERPDLHGLYQLAVPEPISKYDLLCCARDAFGINVEIEPYADFVTRPTLDGSKLRAALDLELPGWPEMMAGLAADPLYKQPVKA